jgi:hypothetical protein
MRVLAESPLSEIILRRYEKPKDLKERELVKKVCLSLGLLQPGDSRDVVVDIMHILLKAKKQKKLLSVTELEKKVIQNRKLHRIPLLGIASSNIRRQLKRIRNLLLVEKIKSRYRIKEFLPLTEIFSETIEGFVVQNIIQRIQEYLQETDLVFSPKSRSSSAK